MKVTVKAEVFKGLREQYKVPRPILAEKIHRKEETLLKWESDDCEIGVGILEKIANIWGCHWSIFLSEAIPPNIKKPKSHRKSHGSNDLSLETILAYQQAQRLLALSAEIGGQKINENFFYGVNAVSLRSDPENLAILFRDTVGLDPKNRFGKIRNFDFWREKIEGLGVYVSVQYMPKEEVMAFISLENSRAVLVINRREEYESAKIFSLLHEVGHIFLGESAACDLHSEVKNPDSIERAEIFCNRFAGAVLLPQNIVKVDEIINNNSTKFDDKTVSKLSKQYRVSFSVVLRRLATLGYISPAEYQKRYKYFQENILPKKLAEQRKKNKDFIPGPYFHPNRWVTAYSPRYSSEVFSSFYDNKISYGELTRYLGVALEHVPKIQRYLGYE